MPDSQQSKCRSTKLKKKSINKRNKKEPANLSKSVKPCQLDNANGII